MSTGSEIISHWGHMVPLTKIPAKYPLGLKSLALGGIWSPWLKSLENDLGLTLGRVTRGHMAPCLKATSSTTYQKTRSWNSPVFWSYATCMGAKAVWSESHLCGWFRIVPGHLVMSEISYGAHHFGRGVTNALLLSSNSLLAWSILVDVMIPESSLTSNKPILLMNFDWF